MYAAEVACDCNAGDIFPMEGEYARSLWTEPCRSFRWRYISVQVLMLAIICSDDFCQKAGYHLDYICDWHPTDLILLPTVHPSAKRMSGWMAGSGKDFFTGEALYMAEISNLDATR